jgi:4-hydroxy-3-polyprenylbenzoate decarboxylase
VLPLVGYLSRDEQRRRLSTKVIYNCLRADDLPAGQLPKRSSFAHAWPQEIQERVRANWKRYGYREES